MANLNRIVLAGKIAAEPETRSTMDGMAMIKLRLLVKRQGGLAGAGYGAGENDNFEVIAWQNLAERAAQSLHKGQLVVVEGRIQIRSFEDQTGERRWATEIVARDFFPLEDKRGGAPVMDEGVSVDAELASDLPF